MGNGEVADSIGYIERLVRADDRCRALRDGLEQLDDTDIARLRQHLERSEPVVLDEVNYDERTGLWCPLAVGISVSSLLLAEGSDVSLDDHKAKDIIRAEGRNKYGSFSLNPIKGVSGDFYRNNRYADLRRIVDYIIFDRAR